MENGYIFKILIIEDSFIYRKLLKETIQSRYPEMRILEAKDGEEALKEIKIAPPDLIFMDIKLPGKSGLELTKKIKGEYPKIPIIILTSYDLPEYREAANLSKANFFLSKAQATKEGILSIVETILSKHRVSKDME